MTATDNPADAGPLGENPPLAQEDIYALRYFWEEKGDITRWLGLPRAMPALQQERPDILAAWAAYQAATQRMHEVVQSDTRVEGVVGPVGPIEIVRPDDDTVEFRLSGDNFANFNYDMHGSHGMESAETLVRELAARLGLKVVEIEGDE